MRILICLLAAAAALIGAQARADNIYKWVDRNGRIHYSDAVPGKDSRAIAIQDRLSRASVGSAAHQHHGGGPQKPTADQQDPHGPRDEGELDQSAEDAHGGGARQQKGAG